VLAVGRPVFRAERRVGGPSGEDPAAMTTQRAPQRDDDAVAGVVDLLDAAKAAQLASIACWAVHENHLPSLRLAVHQENRLFMAEFNSNAYAPGMTRTMVGEPGDTRPRTAL
jgi:hypothetical protein